MIENITIVFYFYSLATINGKSYRKICYFDNVVEKRRNLHHGF